MLLYAQYAIMVALGATVLSSIGYIWAAVQGHQLVTKGAQKKARVLVGGDLVDDLEALDAAPAPTRRVSGPLPATIAKYASWLAWGALGMLTLALVLRTVETGRGPFVTQHEFAVSMAWGFLVMYLFFEWKYRARTLALVALPMTVVIQLYALSWDSTANPLVPALQNSFLLTLHILVAIFAYGAFLVSFAAAVLYLIDSYFPGKVSHLLPKADVLDRLGYRATVIGYPLMTMVIVLGAVWAEIAWGRYWSWDPKETASLVTWLIYGGYLHARVARGWVGRGAAWLLVIAFVSVIFTFFGNAIFGGLHSYGVV